LGFAKMGYRGFKLLVLFPSYRLRCGYSRTFMIFHNYNLTEVVDSFQRL